MTTNNIPEVGSRWTHDGAECTVTSVTKRGRGYQVHVEFRNSGYREKFRLATFRKVAKPA